MGWDGVNVLELSWIPFTFFSDGGMDGWMLASYEWDS